MADTHDLSEKFYQLQQSTSQISDADGLEIYLVNVLKSMISCNSILVFHNNTTRQFLSARNPFNLSQNESSSLTIQHDDPLGVDILVLRKSISRVNPQTPLLPAMHAELFSPLNSPDKVLGCIYVSRLSSREFGSDDIRIVEHAAGLLARALERRVCEKRLRALQKESLSWQKKYLSLVHAIPFPAMIVDKKSKTPDEANELADQLFIKAQEDDDDVTLTRILETTSFSASRRGEEARVKIGRSFCLLKCTDLDEFDAEKTLVLFMPEAHEADEEERMPQFRAALESLPMNSSDLSDFILQAAALLQQFIAFDYFSITLIDEQSGEAQPFVLCASDVKDQLPDDSQWQAVEKTNLGWVTTAGAQNEAAASVAGYSGALLHNLPVYISFLLVHGENYLGNWALARQQQAPFDDVQQTHLRAVSKRFSKLLVAKKTALRQRAIEQMAKSFLEISSALEEAVDETEIIGRLKQLAPAHLQVKDFYVLELSEHEAVCRLSFLPEKLADVVVGKKLQEFFDMLLETQRPVCVDNQAAFVEYFCAEAREEALREFAPFIIVPVADARRLYACFAFAWQNEFPFPDLARHLLKPLARLVRDRLFIAQLSRRLLAQAREAGRLFDIVTRDLSAPVSEMKGIASLLTQRYSKDLSGRAQEYLQNSSEGLEGFEKLIAGLADYQKIDHFSKISDIDCNAIVQTALARVESQLQNVEIKTPESYPPVRGNEDALLLIFINLLTNAARAVENVRAPVIELGVVEKEKVIEFIVRDNGSGVDPSLQDKIFELFYKQDNSAKDSAGLGLAVVKKAVHAHGGRLWSAAKKSGAEFHFTISKGLVVMASMAPFSR